MILDPQLDAIEAKCQELVHSHTGLPVTEHMIAGWKGTLATIQRLRKAAKHYQEEDVFVQTMGAMEDICKAWEGLT